jgi:hypothetical protein
MSALTQPSNDPIHSRATGDILSEDIGDENLLSNSEVPRASFFSNLSRALPVGCS